MKTMIGNLIELAQEGRFEVIIHGCNCFCTMGAGIAKAIRDAFPEAYEADLATVSGDRSKLGTYSSAVIHRGDIEFCVINAYTQFNWRGRGVKVNYDAVSQVFGCIRQDFTYAKIAYPMIGAGLAGGHWPTIRDIIDAELGNADHTLVRLPG